MSQEILYAEEMTARRKADLETLEVAKALEKKRLKEGAKYVKIDSGTWVMKRGVTDKK